LSLRHGVFIHCPLKFFISSIRLYFHCYDMAHLPLSVHIRILVPWNSQNPISNTALDTLIIFLPGLGRLTCSGIDALPSFPGATTIYSSSRFVVESVFRKSGVVHSFKIVDQVLFVFGFHVLYSRNLQFYSYDKL